jgi:hypothetical protein
MLEETGVSILLDSTVRVVVFLMGDVRACFVS